MEPKPREMGKKGRKKTDVGQSRALMTAEGGATVVTWAPLLLTWLGGCNFRQFGIISPFFFSLLQSSTASLLCLPLSLSSLHRDHHPWLHD